MSIPSGLINWVRREIYDDPVDSADQVYTDERLRYRIAHAAEKTFDAIGISATVDHDTPDVTPELVSANYDTEVLTLIVLRTACLIEKGDLRGATRDSIMVQDGDTRVSTAAGLTGHRMLMEHGACAEYDKAEYAYLMSKSTKVIMTPGPQE